MGKLEKLIYSVKYLPQILYFGSAGLLLLVIFLDVNLIELIIPLFLSFIYMTYLASKNYKSGGIDPIEKMIYSNKYLPSLLFNHFLYNKNYQNTHKTYNKYIDYSPSIFTFCIFR